MKQKKMYRIELKKTSGLAQEMAILAALSNGGTYISLKDIDAIARTECKRYPSLNDNVSVNLIGEHDFTIDRGTENILVLTEVEILELDTPEMTANEARDILDELSPTLHRQTSLLDDTNSELLN
jgi:hypothetical protein